MINRIFRPIPAVALAALIAAAITILPGASEKVVAGTTDQARAAHCAQQTWPYIESACLQDRRSATSAPRSVRLVTTDRLSLDTSARQVMR
jgi:hypothetical protein